MEKKFIAKRLEEAQQLECATNTAVAEELDVSPTAVGNWLKGKAIPRDGHIDRLAEFLDVPPAFFFRAHKAVDLTDKLQFRRAKSNRRKKHTKKVERQLEYFTEGAEVFLSQFEIPVFEDIFADFDPLRLNDADIEGMAGEVRELWDLGNSPIKTLGNLLFNKGIVLLRCDLPEGMSGFSFYDGGRPFIVLGDDGENSRDKLTVGHEFAHILLHHGRFDRPIGELTKEQDDKIEADAYRFAGAFLLPAESYLRDVFAPSIDCLLALKPKWQVSVAAQIRRLKDLGQITDQKYTQLHKNLSWRGMKKKEGNEELLTEERCDQIDTLIKKLKSARPDLWRQFAEMLSDLPKQSVRCWVEESNIIQFEPEEFPLSSHGL